MPMRLDQIAAVTIKHFVGRLARRAAIAAVMALFAIVAIYQLTVAGMVALEMRVGMLQAHLIIAGIYVALALIAFAILWSMRAKPVKLSTSDTPAVNLPLEAQIIMLVEAAMLGYTMARKSGRARE